VAAFQPSVDLGNKFEDLNTQMNVWMVERQREINASITALLAKRHVFLLGSPGIGKSWLVDLLMDFIQDAEAFKILMSRFTTPPEVFGPVSLRGLEEDKFLRKIQGYLPTAHFAFVDEIFKANSSILNALLWAMNERQYRHDEKVIPIPLTTLFCASNELPQSEELGALYDRIDVRLEVKPVRDPANFKRMLRLPDTPRVPILTWDEVNAAQAEVKLVHIPDTVLDQVTELRRLLKGESIEPTERRFRSSLSLIQAAAWLDGCPVADVEHIRPLQHVLWDKPEQQSVVDKHVLAIASPLDQECNELMAEIDRLEQRLDAIENDEDKHRKGTEIHTKLQRAKKDLDDIEKRAGTSRRRHQVTREVRARLLSVTQRVLREVFNLDPEQFLKEMEAKQA
jgi:MoxR-like ATPase